MDVNEITKILQIYALNNVGAGSNNKEVSIIFELILQSMLKDLQNEFPSANNDNYSINDEVKAKKSYAEIPIDIMSIIDNAAKKYCIEGEFIKAVIKSESNFNVKAVSRVGAQGLMQLMPRTAKSIGVNNPFDALENIEGGTKYLKKLLDAFSGNKELALAAYNGGIGRMNKSGIDTVEEISNMSMETRNYVKKVMETYNNYKKKV